LACRFTPAAVVVHVLWLLVRVQAFWELTQLAQETATSNIREETPETKKNHIYAITDVLDIIHLPISI
jgi:hypothetical protein